MNKYQAAVRYLCINFVKEVKKCVVTEKDVRILKFVQARGLVVAEDLMREFKLATIQQASSKLKQLYTKGYLDRMEYGHKTGGIMYQYKVVIKIK